MKGLSFRKTSDALAEFVKRHGHEVPRRAVLCTYDFHPERFESVVLPELVRRGRWFRTLVLADNAALQQAGLLATRSAEPSYELAPVRLRGAGVFHPKLFLLQAGTRVLVGVGSANLTPGGLGGNLELMLFVDNGSDDGRALAKSAVGFLDALRESQHVVLPSAARRFLDAICVMLPKQRGGPLLHSLGEPLLQQIRRGRPAKVTHAIVVSPWHSSSASSQGIEPEILTAMETALGARPVVHTEGERGNGPDLGKRARVRVLNPSTLDEGDREEDGEEIGEEGNSRRPRRPATLHAKAYLAATRAGGVMWFGSANCTIPALRESVSEGGNVELLVRVELDRRGRERFERDLERMFVDRRGVLAAKPKPRIPAPRGLILGGYADGWEGTRRLVLAVASSSKVTRTTLISRSAKRSGAISVDIAPGCFEVALDVATTASLLDGNRAPAVLWEHVGEEAFAFPVSVACANTTGSAEETLTDVLDELAGRMPPSLATSTKRGTKTEADGEDGAKASPDDDAELTLLTKTAHQGELDRIAVRVELLRKRLQRTALRSDAVRAHYTSIVEQLSLPEHRRRVLLAHLNGRGGG